MGNKQYDRRSFFRQFIGDKEVKISIKEEDNNKDPLFVKYSRKNLDGRKYEDHKMFLQDVDNATEQNVTQQNNTNNRTLNRVGVITSGLTAYTGTWSVEETIHLLNRTTFGAKKTEIDTYVAYGNAADAVDALCNFSVTPVFPSATPLNYYNSISAMPDPTIALGASWTSNNLPYTSVPPDPEVNIEQYRNLSMNFWHWGVYLNDTISIREKMVMFWYHFIPTVQLVNREKFRNAANMSNDYFNMFREHGMGDFRQLIRRIAKSPAMLLYLDNHFSNASNPNENFARELLELFLIGKTPQNYNEFDIQAAAKVLSGWRIVSPAAFPYPHMVGFNPAMHFQNSKQFSAFFNNTVIVDFNGTGGSPEFEDFFVMLFQYQGPVIAKHICRKLYRFFVYYDIDANIETNVIEPLATLFINSNWSIEAIMKALFKSQHFYDMVNRGVMIKTPIDLVAKTIRLFEYNMLPSPTSSNPVQHQYETWKWFDDYSKAHLIQSFGIVPDVAGWKAYYQSPGYYQNWINSGTIQKRSALLTTLTNGATIVGVVRKINILAFIQQFPATSLSDPNYIVNQLVKYLLPLDIPQTSKTEFKVQTLLANQVTDSYWTSAWASYISNPTAANTSNVETKLKSLLNTILQLAEYQLM